MTVPVSLNKHSYNSSLADCAAPTRRLESLLQQTCRSNGASASSNCTSQTDLGIKRRGLKQMLFFQHVVLFFSASAS